MPARYRRLAIMAGAVGMIAALAPAAAASAASAWRFPIPSPSSPARPPAGGLITGKVLFSGFPAGMALTGGLGTTWEKCVTSTNGRTFSTEDGSTIDASIIAKSSGFPSFCSTKATQSIWRLYLNSPPPYVGAVVFGLSQDAAGDPYSMICGPSEGGIQCHKPAGSLQIDVVAHPSLGGLTGPKVGGALVTGTVTFRGFPAGTTLSGGKSVTWSRCVTGNSGGPFTTEAGKSLDVTISVNNDIFPSFCNERASQSIWRLYLDKPPPYVGGVIFTLAQDASGLPYTMACGISEGGIKCQTSTDERHIVVVPNPSFAGLLSGDRG
jgi:hypothetical protein